MNKPLNLTNLGKKQEKGKPKNPKKKLTSHVITRWYRPPEIILMERDYGYAVDTWAMGCVIGEVLKLIRTPDSHSRNTGALFPGYCCYPLSPADKDQGEVNGFPFNHDDQLYYILDTLGTPDPESDLTFLSDKEALKYLKSMPKRAKSKLKLHYPNADTDTLDILEKLLAFDPAKRITIEECLRHPFFDEVIEEGHNILDSEPINLHFESDLEKNLAEENLRDYFLDEFTIANSGHARTEA